MVKPIRGNNRIVKQDGAFIISGLCSNKEEAEGRIEKYRIHMMDVWDREKILSELDSFGINEASLFPEIDKVADYLKEKYKT